VVMAPSPRVLSILVQGSNVYLGGIFTTVQGRQRNGLAIVEATSGLLSTWDPYISALGSVQALALEGTTLYVGGLFSSAGGLPRMGLAAFETVHGFFTNWEVNEAGLAPNSLIVSGNNLYVANSFIIGSIPNVPWP